MGCASSAPMNGGIVGAAKQVIGGLTEQGEHALHGKLSGVYYITNYIKYIKPIIYYFQLRRRRKFKWYYRSS